MISDCQAILSMFGPYCKVALQAKIERELGNLATNQASLDYLIAREKTLFTEQCLISNKICYSGFLMNLSRCDKANSGCEAV